MKVALQTKIFSKNQQNQATRGLMILTGKEISGIVVEILQKYYATDNNHDYQYEEACYRRSF